MDEGILPVPFAPTSRATPEPSRAPRRPGGSSIARHLAGQCGVGRGGRDGRLCGVGWRRDDLGSAAGRSWGSAG